MIKDVKDSFSGDIIKIKNKNQKPFQFQPKLFFDNSFDSEYRNYSIPVLNMEQPKDYLEELSIYINDNCNQKCSDCKHYYKQTIFCKTRDQAIIYPFNDLKQLFSQAQRTTLNRLNILGGDIFLYPNISELISYLNNYPTNNYYYINHLNLNPMSMQLINLINKKKDQCVILIPPPLTESPLNNLLSKSDLKYHSFTFLIREKKDLDCTLAFIKKFSISHSSIVPFYTGENMSFFKQDVFVNRESIEEELSDIETILRRDHLNDAGFKKLYVFPNKKVFSNLNLPAIADLNQDTLISAIECELKEGIYWKLLRRDVAPCKECSFQLLCPPISNYDFVINQHNLCTIWEK